MTELDHLILNVNDRAASMAFYTQVLGFADGGMDGPFAIVRVNPACMVLLATRPTTGGEHLAFAMSRSELDAAFARIRAAGVPFGDAFDSVGSGRGPGDELGARGMGKALYCFDPNRHLIELRYYD